MSNQEIGIFRVFNNNDKRELVCMSCNMQTAMRSYLRHFFPQGEGWQAEPLMTGLNKKQLRNYKNIQIESRKSLGKTILNNVNLTGLPMRQNNINRYQASKPLPIEPPFDGLAESDSLIEQVSSLMILDRVLNPLDSIYVELFEYQESIKCQKEGAATASYDDTKFSSDSQYLADVQKRLAILEKRYDYWHVISRYLLDNSKQVVMVSYGNLL